MIAAAFVALMNSGAPDLIVAGIMSALFLTSSYQILRQSWAEWQSTNVGRAHEDTHDHDGHDHAPNHEHDKPQ